MTKPDPFFGRPDEARILRAELYELATTIANADGAIRLAEKHKAKAQARRRELLERLDAIAATTGKETR